MQIIFLINKLEHDSFLPIKWFKNNHMKLNQGKSNFLIPRNKYKKVCATPVQTSVKLLRKIKNTDRSIFAGFTNVITLIQRRTLMKTFI